MIPLKIFTSRFNKCLLLFQQGILVLVCLIFRLPFPPTNEIALAESAAPTTESEPPFMDTAQEQASKVVLDSAVWLDDLFNNERVTSEGNKTRLRLGLDFGYSKNDKLEFKPTLSGRIDLPHLSRKLNLVISASTDEDFLNAQNPISAVPQHQEKSYREITTGLQYYFIDEVKSNFSTTTGVSLGYLFTGIRYRHSQDFGPWKGRFFDQFQYFTDDGFKNTVSYELQHYFSDIWLFRSVVAMDWYKNRDGYPHSLIFRLYQAITNEKAILYEVGNYFNTDPSYKLADTQVLFRCRQRFLRDWLVLELAPQVTFPEDHDRKINPGIIVKFEADVGNLSGRDILSGIFAF
jgi:hypothetical protein